MEVLAELIRDHGGSAVTAAIDQANRDGAYPAGEVVVRWTWYDERIAAAREAQAAEEHAKREAEAAARKAEVDAIMRTILPTKAACDHEAEVAAAVKWIEAYFGTYQWADPHKMARAAKKAGFSGYVHGLAKDRLKLRREKGISGRWFVALPEAA